MHRWGAGLIACALLGACVSPGGGPAASEGYADFLIGRVASARNDHAAAADRYFAALSRAPGDVTLREGAVLSALAAGDHAAARQAAYTGSRAQASSYANLVRAADALRASRWDRASEELNAIQGNAAEELIARMLVVWARTGAGRLDEVSVDLAPLIQMRPYGALFAYQQAMALDYAGRNQEALAAYMLAQQGGLWLPSGIERHADLLAREGAQADAVTLLSAEYNRPNPALMAALARVESGAGASSDPLTPARGASVTLYGLAAIFQQERDPTSALATLALAFMLDPQADAARLAFAQQQAQLGHDALARDALDNVAVDSPYFSSARVMEAWILLDAGEEAEALAIVRDSATRGDRRAQRAMADMLVRLERYSEAEPLYSELVGEQPNDWRLLFARGAARERVGRWEEAEADLQAALALSPNQPDVLNYLGYSWVDRGVRLEEGLALIQRAVELRPHSAAIVDSLGWAYYRLGDYDKALLYLERAVELDPADPTLNDHLGDLYWRLGRRIEARFQWQRAQSLQPDNAEAFQAKIDNGLPQDASVRAANP